MKKTSLLVAAVLCAALCLSACSKKDGDVTVTPAGQTPTTTSRVTTTTVFTGQLTMDHVLMFSMSAKNEIWPELSRYNHTVAENGSWVFPINDAKFQGTLTAMLNEAGEGENYILSNGTETIDILVDSVSDYMRRTWKNG